MYFGLLSVSAGLGLLLAQSYPHAFPREGTTKLFENERITIWEVVWKNGVSQPVHRHLYDMAGVYLRYAEIRVTTPDGKVAPAPPRPFEVPRPYFQPKDITHREEAIGGPERLAIMVDLKGSAPAAVEPAPKNLEPAFPREGAKDVLDNARVRMWDYTWQPKKPVALHVHDRDSIEVFFEGGTLLTKSADGHEEKRTVAFKDARFVPQNRADSEEAISGSPRAIIIELK